MKDPRISIVGAGPGDPELITLKGAKAIQSADVILYDALVNEALLGLAPEHAELIYVGKRAGERYLSQEEIKLLLVQSAYKHGHAVRLKGGDPMVFARGYEELDYARAFGIETVVIPGISSALAAPISQGVPLTHRDLSRSFWVVTATTSKGELSHDMSLAAQSSATIVVLMGMRKLSQIVRLLQDAGKGDLPMMIVQNATLANSRHVAGTVNSIEALAQEKNLGTPATMVIGDVVQFHPDLVQQTIESATSWQHR